MSDDVKDFRYYADKAESALNEAAKWDDQMLSPVIRQRLAHAADVYARLACGALKSEPEFCVSRSPGSPGTSHQHDCELAPHHEDLHTCGCGTEWA